MDINFPKLSLLYVRPWIVGWILMLILIVQVKAQEFGGNPPKMKWEQIDSDSLRVIFPTNLRFQAQRVANMLTYLNRNSRESIGEKEKKIDVVLQNQTVVSNGYVALSPFRSEFYMNAPQSSFDLGSNWLDMLSIHEFRHALQFMNTRRGLTKAAYFITGQYGWGYFSSLSIPNWFWEGDAVVMETALTAQGRGRVPAFYNGYKSIVLNHETYPYRKARNGSLKDYVPNHYELGFLLCNYGREQYSNDFWKEVVVDASRYKGLFYPFSKAVKRKTGLPVKKFYDEAMSYYSSKWDSTQIEVLHNSSQVNKLDKKGTFTSYQYPQQQDDGGLIVYKQSFKKIGGFYVLDENGEETLIRRQGRVLDSYFTQKNGKIAWAEYGQDERWSWKSYSNIVIFDLSTKKRKRINHSSKYFSPDLSFDGKKIVVFETTPELKYNLSIISSDNGDLITRLPNIENYYFSYPKWSEDDKSIVTLARDGLGRVGILRVNVVNGNHEVIFPFTNHQLGIPYITKNHIYFSASFSGVDNIYALDLKTKDLYQVTAGKLGSYQVIVNKEETQLYYSQFTSLGNNIQSMDINPDNWKKVDIVEPVDMTAYDFVAVKAEGGDITSKIPSLDHSTSSYPKSSKLVKLHSWSFYFAEPNYEWALQSNNILNTLAMNLGVNYNRNDQNFRYFFDASYAQFYPVLSFSASTGKRKSLAHIEDEDGNVVGSVNVGWWESYIKPGITIPFDLSSGLYGRKLNLSGLYAYTNVNFDKPSESLDPSVMDFSYNSYTTGVSFLNRRKKAKQNIFAKNSQFVSLSYDRSIDPNPVDQLFVDSEWTFPGLFPNHNLVFQVAYQKETQENFSVFSDNFRYARGYNRPLYDQIYKIGSNYHFPMVYPDWGFGGLIYLYRFRGNVFFDFSRSYLIINESNTESIQLYNSLGAEFVLDTRILNLYDFSFGFRYSYLLNEDPQQSTLTNTFEFFIPLMRF